MSDIVLATLNARYAHASLGLRCLRANLGELRERSVIREFVIGQKTEEIAEKAAGRESRASSDFGVYIWNVEESTRLVAQLKTLAPEVSSCWAGRKSATRPTGSASARWPIT
jgi:hypothetical protein